MLVPCPFDLLFTITGVRFTRIQIDALAMALVAPRAV